MILKIQLKSIQLGTLIWSQAISTTLNLLSQEQINFYLILENKYLLAVKQSECLKIMIVRTEDLTYNTIMWPNREIYTNPLIFKKPTTM